MIKIEIKFKIIKFLLAHFSRTQTSWFHMPVFIEDRLRFEHMKIYAFRQMVENENARRK